MRQRAKSRAGKKSVRVNPDEGTTPANASAREEPGVEGGAKEEEQNSGREWLLAQIAEGARHCKAIEAEFGKNPPPELETLIKVHRVMVLQLSSQKETDRETIGLVTALMRPVMEWARLQEKRKERELAEEKYRAQAEAQKAAKSEGGLSPETLEKIERELRLM